MSGITDAEIEELKRDVFGNPSLPCIMDAVPNLHWRDCRNCYSCELHIDSITPWVNCRRCGSQDTRPAKKPNQMLKERVAELRGEK
jgi:hypothetical protein